MKHFSCTLASPRQTVEVDAEDYTQAQKIAAVKIGTRRVRDIYVIKMSAPKHTAQQLTADTTEE